MTNELIRIPAVWMRGGTSKGLFFKAQHLPSHLPAIEAIVLQAIGSPDPYEKQLDGIGGATSSTSKVAIINASERVGVDVDYTFGHVAVNQPVVDWSGNCGNLTAAVAHFAIEERLVKNPVSEGVQVVNIWQTNLQQYIKAFVPVKNGLPLYTGEDKLAGVPGAATSFKIDFLEPSTGVTLPTGHAVDTLQLASGSPIMASIVDAGNYTVFVEATSLQLTGCELPDQLRSVALLQTIEDIRVTAMLRLGLIESRAQAVLQPATPKVALVSAAQSYMSTDNTEIAADQMDICSRIFSMGQPHGAFTGTGAVAAGIAALIPGTLVHQQLQRPPTDGFIRIGHPAGIFTVGGRLKAGELQAEAASIIRSARRLMEGRVCIRHIQGFKASQK